VEGDLQRALGANLRVYRSARNLSQEGFADVLGVHRTYMGAIERGERNLTLQSVERLADRLGVPAIDLLRDPVAEGEPGAAPEAARAVVPEGAASRSAESRGAGPPRRPTGRRRS
jgi:transcriptional regulator with XRE-family HTH domain